MNVDAQISRRRVISGAALTLAALTVSAPAPGNRVLAQDKIRITTTIGMITDTVRNVGGDRVEVTGLMGPGVDPHLYRPSAGDINALGDADIIFYGGLELEGRLTDTLEMINRSGTPTIPVSESVPTEHLRASETYEDQYDPHVWFDVTLWKYVVEVISETLSEHSPDDAELFQGNADAYLTQLDELDAYVLEQADRLPEDQRVLITAHDAFGYFGERYGFEVRGLQGISTASEAGASDIQDLADFIAEMQIRAIFVESSVPPATVEAVQEACRARGWDVQIGGELFSDAMGQDGTEEGTYIGMVRHNIDTIASALLGEDAE